MPSSVHPTNDLPVPPEFGLATPIVFPDPVTTDPAANDPEPVVVVRPVRVVLPTALPSAAVPEPAAVVPALIGGMCLLGRRSTPRRG